jgi:hypothetical protein
MEIRVILRLWNRRLDRVPEAYTIYYVAGVDKLVEEVKRLLS